MSRAGPGGGVSRRDFIAMLGALATGASGVLSGCGSSKPLRVASHVWPGYEFMFVARDRGWLKPEDATLIETASATDSLQLLSSGRVEAAALTLDEVLIGLQRGIPLSVVLLFDASAGADAVLAKPSISSLADLKGARIGAETTALGRLMLHQMLERAGLVEQQVSVVSLKQDQHLSAWQRGKLDAIITYEPTVSVIEQGGWKRLFDSVDIPDTIFDVLAVRRDRAGDFSRQLHSLIQAHFQAQHSWKTNPMDSSYRMARRLNVPADEVSELYRGIELPDIVYNRHMLGGESARMVIAAHEIAEILDIPAELVNADLFQAEYLD